MLAIVYGLAKVFVPLPEHVHTFIIKGLVRKLRAQRLDAEVSK